LDINRALFLSLTASMVGGAALSAGGCHSDDAPSRGAPDASPDGAATSDATTVTDGTVGDVAGDGAVDGTADTAVDAIADGEVDVLADQASGDSAAFDAPSDSADAADASDASSLPSLPDGGVTEACAPFTCELGQANCLAAYGGGVGQDVAVALYACAQTVCATDSGVSSFTAGTSCAAAALGATAPDPSVTSFCAPSADCAVDAGILGVSDCERYFSSLTPNAFAAVQTIVLHDAGLKCIDTSSLTFEVLGVLADP
jgi:hypothetical protein